MRAMCVESFTEESYFSILLRRFSSRTTRTLVRKYLRQQKRKREKKESMKRKNVYKRRERETERGSAYTRIKSTSLTASGNLRRIHRNKRRRWRSARARAHNSAPRTMPRTNRTKYVFDAHASRPSGRRVAVKEMPQETYDLSFYTTADVLARLPLHSSPDRPPCTPAGADFSRPALFSSFSFKALAAFSRFFLLSFPREAKSGSI